MNVEGRSLFVDLLYAVVEVPGMWYAYCNPSHCRSFVNSCVGLGIFLDIFRRFFRCVDTGTHIGHSGFHFAAFNHHGPSLLSVAFSVSGHIVLCVFFSSRCTFLLSFVCFSLTPYPIHDQYAAFLPCLRHLRRLFIPTITAQTLIRVALRPNSL